MEDGLERRTLEFEVARLLSSLTFSAMGLRSKLLDVLSKLLDADPSKLFDMLLFLSMILLYSLARAKTEEPRDRPPPDICDLDSTMTVSPT